MTLVELLVVVTILMLLAAFAIPAMRPLTQGRRIREAVRAVDVFLTQAKIRAVEIQRPVGVLFERVRQTEIGGATVYQDDACNVLRLVEIPPPYAGEFSNSRVRVQSRGIVGTEFVLGVQIQLNDFSNGLLRVGDRIQFNYQGPFFTIHSNTTFERDANNFLVFIKPSDTNYAADKLPAGNLDGFVDTEELVVTTPASELGGVPWPSAPNWSAGVPFQIHRQPQPSPAPPLRLPKDTVIDLADSGYYIGLPDPNPSTPIAEGSDVYFSSPKDRYAFEIYQQSSGEDKQFPDAFGRIGDSGAPDVDNYGPMILFAPNGAIQSVYHWKGGMLTGLPAEPPTYGPFRVTRPVFLMIGKWERTGHETIVANQPVRSLAEDQLHNWQDASNIWMAIGPHNGMVTSAQVNAPTALPTGVFVPGDPEDPDPGNLGLQMQISRAYAREAQISKGALEE